MEDNYIIAPVVEGQVYEPVVKVGDTLPIGTEVDYEGAEVPNGWEEVTDYDTGWQNLTLLNSVTSRGTNYTPQYRKIGKVVYIRGQVNIPSHNSGIIMATLPIGYRPSMEAKLFGVVTNNWIDTGGNMWVATDTTERTNQVLQCEFLVD